jgi:hypothetical protein
MASATRSPAEAEVEVVAGDAPAEESAAETLVVEKSGSVDKAGADEADSSADFIG